MIIWAYKLALQTHKPKKKKKDKSKKQIILRLSVWTYLVGKEFKTKPVNIRREMRENMKNMKQEVSKKNQLEILDIVAV